MSALPSQRGHSPLVVNDTAQPSYVTTHSQKSEACSPWSRHAAKGRIAQVSGQSKPARSAILPMAIASISAALPRIGAGVALQPFVGLRRRPSASIVPPPPEVSAICVSRFSLTRQDFHFQGHPAIRTTL
jgi:hypothetical protein